MNKKLIALFVLIAAGIGLFLYVQYHYYYEPKPIKEPTYSKAQYDKVLKTQKDHDAINAQIVVQKDNSITNLKNKQQALCALVKSKKVAVDPLLCQ